MFDFNRKRNIDEIFNGTEESSSLDLFDRSSGSSVINSPEIARWVEPDPIITVPSVPDASKVSTALLPLWVP